MVYFHGKRSTSESDNVGPVRQTGLEGDAYVSQERLNTRLAAPS